MKVNLQIYERFGPWTFHPLVLANAWAFTK